MYLNLYCRCGCECGVTGEKKSSAIRIIEAFKKQHSGKGHELITYEEYMKGIAKRAARKEDVTGIEIDTIEPGTTINVNMDLGTVTVKITGITIDHIG